MTQTNNVSGTSSLNEILNEIDLGPGSGSVQFLFAKLQLAQAQICKNSATQYLKSISEIQEDQAKVAEMIQLARQCKEEAASKDYVAMPDEMKAFFDEKKLTPCPTGSKGTSYNKDAWTYNLESLTDYQETLSNKTQTQMDFLQDFISQYNSYLQGANSAIQEASQVLQSIATGR